MGKMPDGEERTKSQVPPPLPSARRLIAVWPDGSSIHDLLHVRRLVVGRSSGCDVLVAHGSISRRHVELRLLPKLTVEDLSSSNGTWLGASRLRPHTPTDWPAGVIVRIGLAMLVVQEPEVALERPAAAPNLAVDRRSSAAMDGIHRLVEVIAPGTISVILQGETGVGKEVLASHIHAQSPRAAKPLVAIHCAALPETLLEAELFGYERGAFTGATSAKPGLLESANGGTVLLDEIGEMPLATQPKLLRVLEGRQVQRLGSVTPRPLDVRVLAATHRDLAAMVATKEFRSDLYYRLNGVTIEIPPLRERPSEIGHLASLFAAQASAQLGPRAGRITSAAMRALSSYSWPGNIRELRNAIERAALLAGGDPIDAAHVAPALASRRMPAENASSSPASHRPRGGDLKAELREVERQRVLEALSRTAGNQTQAAKLLGMSRRALLARLDTYDVPRPKKKNG